MKYDYVKDIMVIEGVDYQLKPYRKWLLANHENLVTGHFVKSLKIDGRTKFYYDWQYIYFLAAEYNFLDDYLKTIN